MTSANADELQTIDELYQVGEAAILARDSWWDKLSGTSEQALQSQYETLKIELTSEGWNPGTTQGLRDLLTDVQNIPAIVSDSLQNRVLALYDKQRVAVGDTNIIDTANNAGGWLKDNLGGALAWVKWIAIGGLALFVLLAVGRALSWVPRRE